MIIIITTLVAALQVISKVDKIMQAERKQQDEDLYDYCLNRMLVICPHCRIGFEVTDLTEQMNLEWQCECCRVKFVEYSTHTK